MTREKAIIILTNTASLLRDGTRYMKLEHEKQFREAYETAIKALEKPEIIRCKNFNAKSELIRCKDCKYSHLTRSGECKYCDQWVDEDGFAEKWYLPGDFYCAYAERREDE